MVDHLGPCLLHCVQDVTEVAQVAADNLHVVSEITQMVTDRITAEDYRRFLTVFNE
jgi:hypothetical protein